jgi:hypothetical protein
MKKYTVIIKATDATRFYTTEAYNSSEALVKAGRAYRMTGNNTDNITEIQVRER